MLGILKDDNINKSLLILALNSSFKVVEMPLIQNGTTSLAMSTSFLKALPGKLDIKRHSPSILYIL